MRAIIVVRGQEFYENDTRGTYHCLVGKLTMSSLRVTYVSLLTPFFSELEYRSHDDKNTQSLVGFIKNIYVEKNNTFNF